MPPFYLTLCIFSIIAPTLKYLAAAKNKNKNKQMQWIQAQVCYMQSSHKLISVQCSSSLTHWSFQCSSSLTHWSLFNALAVSHTDLCTLISVQCSSSLTHWSLFNAPATTCPSSLVIITCAATATFPHETCHPHFILQISVPNVVLSSSSSVALQCPLYCLSGNAIIISSQPVSKLFSSSQLVQHTHGIFFS